MRGMEYHSIYRIAGNFRYKCLIFVVFVLAKTPKRTLVTQIVGVTNNLAHMTQLSQVRACVA